MDILIKSFLVLLLLSSLNILGQQTNKSILTKRNSLFLEVGGQSLYASVSYDRLFRTDHKIKNSITCGLFVLPLKGFFFISVPVSYNFIFGQKNHHLELGPGVNFLSESYGKPSYNLLYFSPKVAYRFQKPNGGLFLRFSFVPVMLGVQNYSSRRSIGLYYNSIIYNPDNDGLHWWFGLAVGATFK